VRIKNKKWYERFVGGDRLDLRLIDADVKLINEITEINPNTAVAVIAGSAVIMEEWKDRVPAILMMWYAGMEGGNALARIIFGEVNPSGKLPFTIPKTMEQLPPFDAFAETAEYGYYHGYTLFNKMGYEAAFPFGLGLSYTHFTYDSLKVLTPEVSSDGYVKVKVKLTNTGDRGGAEITQLYVGFRNSSIERPVKLLRAFTRNNLEPAETQTIEMAVPLSELAWYNPDQKQWEVESMEYEVYVGGSSLERDLLKATFTLR
jgi:beta-glucosidase